MVPVRYGAFPATMPERGVYLLSEGSVHLYVGRSNRLPKRVANHGRPAATHRQAAFAFRLAREATGFTRPSYKTTGSCADLMLRPEFVAAFRAAKMRISEMDIRFVEEEDPVRQALLEIYAAIALGAMHNDFDNH